MGDPHNDSRLPRRIKFWAFQYVGTLTLPRYAVARWNPLSGEDQIAGPDNFISVDVFSASFEHLRVVPITCTIMKWSNTLLCWKPGLPSRRAVDVCRRTLGIRTDLQSDHSRRKNQTEKPSLAVSVNIQA